MNKVISRTRIPVPGYMLWGKSVHAASVIETGDGHEAVLIVDGLHSCRCPGNASLSEAKQKIFDLLDPPPDVPTFTVPADWIIEEKKAEPSGAKIDAMDSRSVVNGRVHNGSTKYVITSERREEVEDAITSILQSYHPAGYGTHFDEIELVDGVYRSTGSHRNSCD